MSSILLVGDRLRLLVDDASMRVPELQARLASMNAPFDRIEADDSHDRRPFRPGNREGKARGPVMHNEAPSVVVRDLVKRFGSFTAVDHVSLEASPGEIFGFLGPNGAGKSTTIRILCGLLRPTSGSAAVAGIDVSRRPEAVRQQIGYMSQRFSLYNDLKVIENIRFFAGMYSVPASMLPERIEWVLGMAGLKGRESALTGTLATGWKQRLALGCAVLHHPRIVFLDEPTSGVDPISRRQFWELIQRMASDGATVFVTTHYMDEAEYAGAWSLSTPGGSSRQARRRS